MPALYQRFIICSLHLTSTSQGKSDWCTVHVGQPQYIFLYLKKEKQSWLNLPKRVVWLPGISLFLWSNKLSLKTRRRTTGSWQDSLKDTLSTAQLGGCCDWTTYNRSCSPWIAHKQGERFKHSKTLEESFLLTIITIKLKAWLHWKLCHLWTLPQEWALLTVKQCSDKA